MIETDLLPKLPKTLHQNLFPSIYPLSTFNIKILNKGRYRLKVAFF